MEHERRVAYRAMLEAVTLGKDLPRKALRRLKVNNMETYAKAVANNLNGECSTLLKHNLLSKLFVRCV